MKVLNFAFNKGSHYPPGQAETVGKFLVALQEATGSEELQPKQVVDAARPKASPIHDYFTWDNAKAADKQRLNEASQLLRSIQIEYVDLGPEKRAGTMRMLVNLRRDPEEQGEEGRPSERVYLPMVSVLADKNLRHQLLIEALDQAIHWKNRYGHFKELATIFEAIATVERRQKREKEK